MKPIFVSILALFSASTIHATDLCEEWFWGLKITPGAEECELKCSIVKTDMSSFDCSGRCEEFCKPKKIKQPCRLDDFWQSRLKGKTEPFKSLKEDELAYVKKALSQVPKSYRPSNLKSFVKASG